MGRQEEKGGTGVVWGCMGGWGAVREAEGTALRGEEQEMGMGGRSPWRQAPSGHSSRGCTGIQGSARQARHGCQARGGGGGWLCPLILLCALSPS